MSKTKIHYDSKNFEYNKWYPTPIHGVDFENTCCNDASIPTEWAIQTLMADDSSGDMTPVITGMTYFEAIDVCVEHNETIDRINNGKKT